MEWEAPAIVLDVRPFGEGDAITSIMTREHGLHRGLARGGSSRGKAATWQAGNLLQIQWKARLTDQLGTFTGEMIHPGAALAMQDALPLAMLTSICAVADGALPERVAQPDIFDGLLSLIPRVPLGDIILAEVIKWEMIVLADLGFGLDLSACAATGGTSDLIYVSPRTGRAISREAAGIWANRLLPLPGFLIDKGAADLAAFRDGLRLTGHFLARDAFGHQHRPLPLARRMLYDRIATAAARNEQDGEHNDAG